MCPAIPDVYGTPGVTGLVRDVNRRRRECTYFPVSVTLTCDTFSTIVLVDIFSGDSNKN